MMLGVEDYGSDVESGDETTQQVLQPKPVSSLAARLPPPTKKSTISLPPPSSTTSKPSGAGLSLPPPKKRAPKKIAIGLPALTPDEDERDTELDGRPPAKKPRLETGAGSSGLLSMLPAPKNKAPVVPAQERVLGGGKGPGLVFKTAPSQQQTLQRATVEDEMEEEPTAANPILSGSSLLEEVGETQSSSVSFVPTHIRKGKANVSTEETHAAPKALAKKALPTPAVDFFGLGESRSASSSRVSTTVTAPTLPTSTTSAPSTSTSNPLITGVSSAPKVEDFVPPEPTPQDPYPGYYMLPSGTWAAYDPVYYKSFYNKWRKEYDEHVRRLEKGTEKGFEAVEKVGAQEVNAAKEMEKAKKEIQELEERKSLTQAKDAAPELPKMTIKGAALSGRARSRHQLTTLLTEAYMNREALEERIAQGRRNRKEAGNKYGF